MLLRSAWFGVALPRSAPVQGVSRPPHVAGSDGCGCGLPGWSGVASLCARSRGEPSSAHCEQRLSERLTPCPCDPVCACTGMRGHAEKGKKRAKSWQNDATEEQAKRQPAFLPAPPHAAQRAVTGWRGGLGRVGADLASAGSMRPPPSPARHVSTARLATTPASREAARHHNCQPRNLSTAQHAAKNTKHWPYQSQAAQPDKHWL